MSALDKAWILLKDMMGTPMGTGGPDDLRTCPKCGSPEIEWMGDYRDRHYFRCLNCHNGWYRQ